MMGGVAMLFAPKTFWFSGFVFLAAILAISTCPDFLRGVLFEDCVSWISFNHGSWLFPR
jgi:hypothetical protein